MALEHKNAAGTFPDRQHTESALEQLKAADFPLHNVSVVAQHADSNADSLTPEVTVQSEVQLARHRTIERIEHGAFDAGSWGSIVGFLGGGLVTLAVPGVSSIVLAGARASALIGLATGAFYGGVAGGLLGAAIGTDISEEQVKHYSKQLAQGHDLLVLKGTDAELQQAETILKTQGIQSWLVFDTL